MSVQLDYMEDQMAESTKETFLSFPNVEMFGECQKMIRKVRKPFKQKVLQNVLCISFIKHLTRNNRKTLQHYFGIA